MLKLYVGTFFIRLTNNKITGQYSSDQVKTVVLFGRHG